MSAGSASGDANVGSVAGVMSESVPTGNAITGVVSLLETIVGGTSGMVSVTALGNGIEVVSVSVSFTVMAVSSTKNIHHSIVCSRPPYKLDKHVVEGNVVGADVTYTTSPSLHDTATLSATVTRPHRGSDVA